MNVEYRDMADETITFSNTHVGIPRCGDTITHSYLGKTTMYRVDSVNWVVNIMNTTPIVYLSLLE